MKTILSVLIIFALCNPLRAAETATKLADGHSWKSSSKDERLAYLVGVSEVISVGVQYDRKKVPGNSRTFMRQAYKGLSRASVPQALAAIDNWYRANPDKLDKPVIAVLWVTIAESN